MGFDQIVSGERTTVSSLRMRTENQQKAAMSVREVQRFCSVASNPNCDEGNFSAEAIYASAPPSTVEMTFNDSRYVRTTKFGSSSSKADQASASNNAAPLQFQRPPKKTPSPRKWL